MESAAALFSALSSCLSISLSSLVFSVISVANNLFKAERWLVLFAFEFAFGQSAVIR